MVRKVKTCRNGVNGSSAPLSSGRVAPGRGGIPDRQEQHQGLPRPSASETPRTKTNMKRMRIATLNIGTMTGKGREIVDMI